MNYLSWDEKTITDFSEKNISDMYDHGYVFTRIGKGVMQQTRSVRIDLSKFELSSENKRILKKTAELKDAVPLELPVKEYDMAVTKLAKDFYSTKFGPGIMSAQKIKEMITNKGKSNFNELLIYPENQNNINIGYSICYETFHEKSNIFHYSYPFYDLDRSPADMGMGMMIRGILWAKENGLKYIYLGSLQRPGDVYKLQFQGLEWFDGTKWSTDIEKVKQVLA